MSELLATERAYLKDNVEELAAKYPGRHLLIKGERVYGAFETHDQGVEAGISTFGRGPFLVRSVNEPDPEPYVIPRLVIGVPCIADC